MTGFAGHTGIEVTVTKRFKFSAAHHLPGVENCERVHGHTFYVEVGVTGEPDPVSGMVVDFEDIRSAWQHVEPLLDHQDLNEALGGRLWWETRESADAPPTTELVAVYLLRHFRAFVPATHVRLWEGDNNSAIAKVAGRELAV